ncbi:MAG: FeoA family protein [Desulfosalsimonas sp.]
MQKINVRQMKQRQSGKITAIRARGELGRRMRDMGLVPGTVFTVKGRAPLRDPVALRIAGFTLTLRNSEADFIEVEVE